MSQAQPVRFATTYMCPQQPSHATSLTELMHTMAAPPEMRHTHLPPCVQTYMHVLSALKLWRHLCVDDKFREHCQSCQAHEVHGCNWTTRFNSKRLKAAQP